MQQGLKCRILDAEAFSARGHHWANVSQIPGGSLSAFLEGMT
jgi:hypothetical protein